MNTDVVLDSLAGLTGVLTVEDETWYQYLARCHREGLIRKVKQEELARYLSKCGILHQKAKNIIML